MSKSNFWGLKESRKMEHSNLFFVNRHQEEQEQADSRAKLPSDRSDRVAPRASFTDWTFGSFASKASNAQEHPDDETPCHQATDTRVVKENNIFLLTSGLVRDNWYMRAMFIESLKEYTIRIYTLHERSG